MKVVLDTNVIIAAFAAHGLCHLIFENVIAHHELVLSNFIAKEVRESLTKKIKVPAKQINEIVSFLKKHATMAEETAVPGLKCRDENDLKVLFTAVNASADVLVTGDKDLLVLKSVSQIPILSPRDFWELLRQTEKD